MLVKGYDFSVMLINGIILSFSFNIRPKMYCNPLCEVLKFSNTIQFIVFIGTH